MTVDLICESRRIPLPGRREISCIGTRAYRNMPTMVLIGTVLLRGHETAPERTDVMTGLLSLSTLFLTYLGVVAIAVAGALLYTFRGRSRVIALGAFALWLAYAGTLTALGVLSDPSLRPPGIVLLVAPVFTAMVLTIGFSPVGRMLAAALPLALLIGFQVFRIGVELTIQQLHEAGLIPKLMTLEGGNFELLVALTAPIVAFVAMRGAIGRRIALAWNAIGLLSLLNVAARAVLTAPGPLNLIHAEVPNVGFGTFPFGLIPGFMAPLAVSTHILTFRALRLAGRGTSQFNRQQLERRLPAGTLDA